MEDILNEWIEKNNLGDRNSYPLTKKSLLNLGEFITQSVKSERPLTQFILEWIGNVILESIEQRDSIHPSKGDTVRIHNNIYIHDGTNWREFPI